LERRFFARFPVPLHNLYGPTEAAVEVTAWECERGGKRTAVPLGRPIANTEIHLLDRRGQAVPVGIPGELAIAGVQVGRGYYGRPELTAEKFLPDPFAGRPGARLYRTGDLARRLPGGEIEYLGRIDHQVKIRGLRIELGEIESALAACPGVRAAVVLVQPDAAGDPRLVAFVVAGGEPAPAPAALCAALAGRLPAYMVPAVVAFLPVLPLLPNGKVDRRALVGRVAEAGERVGRVLPRTPIEELIAGIWEEVLGEERTGGRVGVDDSFFALGGHSLLATRVAARLRERFGVDLPLRRLFEAPTVAELAAAVGAALAAGASGAPAAPTLGPRQRGPEIPLSFAQERLWLLDQLDPGSAVYAIPAAVRLAGPLDIAALAAALGEIARRHEALRTTFAGRPAGPVQIVAPAATPTVPSVPVVDLAALPADPRAALADTLATAAARRPFDLAAGPLLRTTLLRLSPEDHLVLWNVHHIVADGWSLGVFLRELGALYGALREGRPAALPALPVQYADFALWQREWLSGPALEARLARSRERLAGAPTVLDLPTDRPRPPARRLRGAQEPVALPA
ncbi:MAG TPA: condensation domain-containing protein, partial [Thermoanaerobaculia bacterium]|nr:condensation domain-containing protein [Thermoanaerobaculia bacterium]